MNLRWGTDRGARPDEYRGEDRRLGGGPAESLAARPLLAAALLLACVWALVVLGATGVLEPLPAALVPMQASLDVLMGALAVAAGVLCLLRWQISRDTRALRSGFALLLLAVGMHGFAHPLPGGSTLPETLVATTRFVVVALFLRALVAPAIDTRFGIARLAAAVLGGTALVAVLVAGLPQLATFGLCARDSGAFTACAALPAVLLWLGAGVLHVVIGVRRHRQLAAWLGVALIGLGLADLQAIVGDGGWSAGWSMLRIVALFVAVFGASRDVRTAFVAQAHRLLASVRDAEAAEARARLLRESHEERAHESRSALLAIEGAASTLERVRDDLDPAARRALTGAISAEIGRLRGLISAAPGADEHAPFEVQTVLEPVVACALAAGIDVSADIPAGLVAVGSAAYTAEVVQQLLLNAQRHAPGSAVHLSACRDGSSVLLRVRDEGAGVPAHERDVIFLRRVQGAGSGGGTGLGLYIARQLMRAQGGDVWVDDDSSGGACFALRLVADERQPAPAEQASAMRGFLPALNARLNGLG